MCSGHAGVVVWEVLQFCVQSNSGSGILTPLEGRRNIPKVEFWMHLGLLFSSCLCLPRKLFGHMRSELFSLESQMIIFGLILHVTNLNSSKHLLPSLIVLHTLCCHIRHPSISNFLSQPLSPTDASGHHCELNSNGV